MSLLRSLASFSLFQDFSEPELRALVMFMEEKSFQDGELILDMDTATNDLIFLLSGKAKIGLDLTEKAGFCPVIEGPALLGEVAFADQGTRLALAKAVGPAETATFRFEHFEIIKKQDPVLGMKFLTQLLRSMAGKFRSTTKSLGESLNREAATR